MATSPYFSSHIYRKSEQDLQEALVIENIQLFGQDIHFIPMDTYTVDTIIRDPKNIVFDKRYTIEAYFPQNGETDGQQNIMSKFGFRVNKQTEIYISKKRFSEIVPDRIRPLEGDLVYIGDLVEARNSFMNEIFEIKQVGYQNPEWPMGGHYTYKLTVETWIANFEKFQTGDPAIDIFDQSGTAGNESPREAALAASLQTNKQGLVLFDRNNPLSNI